MKYANLNVLLKANPKAKQYFDALPDHVKEQISTRPQGINSIASLRDHAEELTRGDG